MSEEKKDKIKNGQVLAYPIVIEEKKVAEKLRETLEYVQQKSNEYLEFAHENRLYNVFDKNKSKYSYKVLEPIFVKLYRQSKLPSRINRGVLEIVGRTMRQVRDRKRVFDLLMKKTQDPKKWTSKLLVKDGIYIKIDYIKNIKEQVINYKRKNNNELPQDFYALQKPPKVKKKILTYAPDDGQAIKIEKKNNKVVVSFKVIDRKNGAIKWYWLKTNIKLPLFLEDKHITSPDIRFECVRGNYLPVLDFKVTIEKPQKIESGNFITFDWGVRKLTTLCVFNEKGQQLSQPHFVNFSRVQDKLQRIYKDIDHWKSKRDKLAHKDSLFKKCNREIAKRWSKITTLNKEIAHTTANIIVFFAQHFNCSKIYCENLKSLKSQKKSKDKNREINTTVRQKIMSLVDYKARLCGITLAKPVHPAGTSSLCPRCSHKGQHIKASDNKQKIHKTFSWFHCAKCKFSADRDYVACINIARKVLFKKNLKKCTKTVVYKKTRLPDSLFRQDAGAKTHCTSHIHYLKGWIHSVSLSSIVVQKSFNSFKGTIFGILRV
ncbi:zinc ribbon domain-containing protein [Candidatus Uabimicrobium amorphum]|uniref:zinc ribbon domain-containing protein n=1 Tax=Uabimicrobium amorphum TaxID=2596890 RepID=UPI00156371B7|nr:zinc ribbon domain-containing protein [Candidatus Uabimicrobium amorphum]